MADIIFRWAVWNCDRQSTFMLSHSVASFQRFFGSRARYIVYADDADKVRDWQLGSFEILPLQDGSAGIFEEQAITWRKWAPTPRIDPTAFEVRVDSDIFLLREPIELLAFCFGSTEYSWMATQEEFTEKWPYGNFADLLPPRYAPINAGLIGQAPGADLTDELTEAFIWWKEEFFPDKVKYHDEQGAVVHCLQKYVSRGNVMLLDPAKYRVVCPLNNPPVQDLGELTLIHSTYPEHPAFWKFVPQIARVTGLPERCSAET